MFMLIEKPSFASSNYGEFADFISLRTAYKESIEKADIDEMKRIEKNSRQTA
ncbi:MAG: hypothetical protein SPI59_00045 [Finegoldia sp.]|nr:hypothetical protein [Finegoldia sp.]